MTGITYQFHRGRVSAPLESRQILPLCTLVHTLGLGRREGDAQGEFTCVKAIIGRTLCLTPPARPPGHSPRCRGRAARWTGGCGWPPAELPTTMTHGLRYEIVQRVREGEREGAAGDRGATMHGVAQGSYLVNALSIRVMPMCKLQWLNRS